MRYRVLILAAMLLLPCLLARAQKPDITNYIEQVPDSVEFTPEAITISPVKTRPTFNGKDFNAFSKWVNEHLTYPEEAKNKGIGGRVIIQFVITEQGKLADVKVLKGVHPLLDKEAVRAIKSAPQAWKPGTVRDKPVRYTYTFPVIFKIKQSPLEPPKPANSVRIPLRLEEEEEEYYPLYFAETKPSFNGGNLNSFAAWVDEHKVYPQKAKKEGIEGRVIVQFVITKKGKLTNVKLIRGIHPLLDEEAIRVIESAPQAWKPGTIRNKPVSIGIPLQISFGSNTNTFKPAESCYVED